MKFSNIGLVAELLGVSPGTAEFPAPGEDMVDFGTFWNDSRDNSHHTVPSLSSVVINFQFVVRRKAQDTY